MSAPTITGGREYYNEVRKYSYMSLDTKTWKNQFHTILNNFIWTIILSFKVITKWKIESLKDFTVAMLFFKFKIEN